MLSNPADRKKLLDCVKELSDSMLRAEAEKSLQKEAISDIAEELDIPLGTVKAQLFRAKELLYKILHQSNIKERY